MTWYFMTLIVAVGYLVAAVVFGSMLGRLLRRRDS